MDPRTTYLQQIGLRFDPFYAPAVAELEMNYGTFSIAGHQNGLDRATPLTGDPGRPSFFAYFQHPSFQVLGDGEHSAPAQHLLQLLRKPGLACIYGEPGMGKSAMRLAFDADVRRERGSTLVVTHIVGQEAAQSKDQTWERLAQDFATDLLIQVIERFNPTAPSPNEEAVRRLQYLIYSGGFPLSRLLTRLLDDHGNGLLGLSHLWTSVNRSPVRLVEENDALRALVGKLMPVPSGRTTSSLGKAAVFEGVQVARLWGFDRAIVLFDGVDAKVKTVSTMRAVLQSALHELDLLEAHDVYLKLFLPTEMRQVVTELWRARGNLQVTPFEAQIVWNAADLRNLLLGRLRAGRSRLFGFPTTSDEIDLLIIQSAQGSPRRLLSIVRELIEVHAARDPIDPEISVDDWNRMRANWTGPRGLQPAGTDA